MKNEEFQQFLLKKGKEHWRDMPWRGDTRAYYVLVSELMLQQTQVSRVIPKFHAFITRFPDEMKLAEASLSDVLVLWQGLGYNRRAKYLHDATKMIAHDSGGIVPSDTHALLQLPGVGQNTAGAIAAYTYNQPAVFVETNIRTVYIEHFFRDRDDVSDQEIAQVLSSTLDRDNPRRFYQALMDYGAWLKSHGARHTTKSRHYKKQPILEGSVRQMRGEIVKRMSKAGATDWRDGIDQDERFAGALDSLVRDGLVTPTGNDYRLTR